LNTFAHLEHLCSSLTEGKQMNRTYDLDSSVVQRIDAAAAGLAVWQSDLVNYLLANGLDQLDAGALTVPVRPRLNSIARAAGNSNHNEVLPT
jgi:hypothetical protein